MNDNTQKVVEDLVSFLQSKGHKCAIVGSQVFARAGMLDREPNDWDVAIPFCAHQEAIAFLEERGWKNNPNDERVYYGVSLLGFLKKEGCPSSIDLVRANLKDLCGLYISLKNAVSFGLKSSVSKRFEIFRLATKFKEIEEMGLISEKSMEYARRRFARD